MRSVSSAIQAILDADQSRPVTVVKLTLVDASATVIYAATAAVTISSQAYQGDLLELPRIVVSAQEGIDHIVLRFANADWAYSSYHNTNDFDGATAEVSQYFATNAAYTTFEGPVALFSGTIFRPEVNAEVLTLNVMADARMAKGGSVGRVVTNHCGWDFGDVDSNCGYVESATVTTGGAYTQSTWIPITGSAETGQAGVALEPSDYPSNFVKIVRGGSPVYTDLRVIEADLANGQIKLNSTLIWSGTLVAGDKIIYQGCPRDTIRECGRRWKFADSSRQQDKFGGMDYFREQFGRAEPKQGTVAQMEGVVGHIVPIPYGTRWTTPMIVGVHSRAGGGTKDWASWGTDRDGPFAVCVIGEGPLDTGLEDVEANVLLDGAEIRASKYYVNQGWEDKFEILTGTTSQVPADFFPKWDRNKAIPGFSALRNVGYFIMELPEGYELTPQVTNTVWETLPQDFGAWTFIPGGAVSLIRRTRYWSTQVPDVQCMYKGKKVRKYVYSGSNPVSGAYEFSRNPVWQILDVLIAPYREDTSDRWSAGLSANAVDFGSFIDWGDYAEDTIGVYDFDNNSINVERYRSDLYVKSGKRGEVLKMLLHACRGTLVAKDGKVGIVLDAPTGGKGTITGATSTVITESTRTGLVDSTWPDGGVSGLLTGMRVKILTGTGSGQVRTIASNTKNTFTVSSAFSPTPSVGGTFAIYALELTTDNVGVIQVRHKKALHELTNQIIATWQSTKDQGRNASVPIPDTYEDDQTPGKYHFDKFGLNEKTVAMNATTEWQQAVRNGWYELRRELDHNFEFIISDLNIEGLVLEVGDHVLINHDISGISNETARVARIEDGGQATYTLACELTRDHVYLDYPTDDFDSVDISSTLTPPHGVPPHVSGVLIDHYVELDGEQPLVVVDWDQPEWQYANWSVVVDFRYQNPNTLIWTAWTELGISRTRKITFRASRIGMVEVRPVLLSGAGIRADDHLENGTSSGSNSPTTLNDTTKAWVVDEWDGCVAEIISGTGADADDPIREIASNTATQLTVTSSWDITPDGTSVYDIYVAAPVVQEQITAGIGYGFPYLDEDDGDLYLHPGWELGLGCKYLDSDTAPSKNDVVTTGSILLSDGAPEGGTNIHTFTGDGEVRYVGIVYYLDEACTQGESNLTILRHTYHEKDNLPRVVWFPYIPDTVGKEGVRFVATDDGAQVNFGYAVIDEGAGDPSWPSGYTTSGLTSDPYVEDVEVTKPAEGGTRKVIVFNCVDAEENMYRPTDDPGRVYVDGNSWPSGYCTYDIEPDYTPVITPQAIETDTLSWRFRVKKTNIGSESWDAISWNDATSGEYSGNTFVPQYMTSYTIAPTECLNVECVFLRTSATDDTTQNASMKSVAMRFTIYPFFDTVIPTVQVYLGQVGSVGNIYLVINDPKGFVVETAFKAVENWDGEDFDDPTDLTWNRDTSQPYNLTETVNLGEDHNSLIAWAVGYDLDDGNGTVYVQGSNVYDLDKIPVVFGALHVNAGGSVYLSINGREDLKSVQYKTSTTSMPTDVTGGTVINGRSTSTEIESSLADDATLYVRVRGYNATGGSAGGGDASTEDWFGQVTNLLSSQVPTVQPYASQSGSTGTLDLVVYDPDSVLVATSYEAQSGGGDFALDADPVNWTGYDNSSPYDLDYDVTLVEAHTSFIAWGVAYNRGAGVKWITGSHTFDLNIMPSGMGTSVVYSNGNASCDLFGDEDTASWKVAASTSAFPSATTVRAAGADDGQNLTASDVGTLLTASSGDTIYYSAFPYSAVTGGGTEGSIVQFIGNYFDEDTSTDPLTPKVFVVPSQSGSTATLSLTIRDEYLKVTDIEKRTKQGDAAWSSWTDLTGGSGTIGVNEDLTRSQTVTIEEKHNSEIGIRIEWTDEESANRYIYFSHTFDLDTIPSVVCGLSLTLSQAQLAWIGDEDLASIKYLVSTSSMPADVSGGTSANGRNGSEELLGTLTLNQIMYVRVRGYTSTGATGTESAEDWLGTIRRDSTLMPTVQVVATQTGATGTLTLNIEDPDSKMNATSFETGLSPDADPVNWSGYDNSSPYDTSTNPAIEEKHGTVVHWGVRYDIGDGNTWITGSHSFDIDVIPMLVNCSLAEAVNEGDCFFAWQGDEDTASMKYITSTSSMPTEANLDGGGTSVNGRTGLTIIDSNLTAGETIYIRARAYSATGATGTASAEDWTGKYIRSETEIPTVLAIPTQSGNNATVTLTVEHAGGGVTATAFDRSSANPAIGYDNVNDDPTSWDVYDSGAPYTYSKTYTGLIIPGHSVRVYWAVRYAVSGTDKWIMGLCEFDADKEAEIHSCTFSYDSDNTINLHVRGDEDCENIYVTVTSSGIAPGDPTSGSNDGSINANQGTIQTSITGNQGDMIIAKIIGYNNESSPEAGPVTQFVEIRGGTEKLPIEVKLTPSQPTATTGRMYITISDPGLIVQTVKYAKKTGAGDFGSFTDVGWDYSPDTIGVDATLRFYEDVDLLQKHQAGLKYEIVYKDHSGTNITTEGGWTFDADLTAEIQSIEINIEDDGSVWATVVADEDAANIYLTCSIDAEPSAPTTGVYDATVSGREGYVNTTKDATDFEHVAWVKVGAADSGGVMGPIIEAKIRRPGGEVSKVLRIACTGVVRRGNSTGTWASTAGYTHPMSADTVTTGYVGIELPPGVLITKASCRLYELNSSSVSAWSFHYATDTGAETYLAGGSGSTGWNTDYDNISHVRNPDYHYYFYINCDADSVNTNSRFAYVELEYTSYDVDETL